MAEELEISDADIELLRQPLDPPGKYEAVVSAKLRRSAVHAAGAVIDLALNSDNDSIRLKAAQYIIDRTLGRIPDALVQSGTEATGWEKIVNSTLVEPSHNDRQGGRAIEPRRR
jgi:hypothetical protein